MSGSADVEIALSAVTDWDALGTEWRALEGRSGASFFQSWSWVGCMAPERYANPVLLRAGHQGRTVALGLFNRQRGWLLDTLWLHETGDPHWDTVFIEHNGLLIDATVATDALRLACLVAARRAPLPQARIGRRLVLRGVDEATLRAAGAAGVVSHLMTRAVPTLDLAALRRTGRNHSDVLSANTRAQLRRSARAYAALGPLGIRRAAAPAEAHRFLDALAGLHQVSWQRRGRAGAFAEPRFARFHHALIDRAFPRGEIALWRVAAGAAIIGYLYNFQLNGRILAYQSGFNYALGDQRAKPGVTCHQLAIEQAVADNCQSYDFLAGDDRYKRSLADQSTSLHWLAIGPRLDPGRLRRGQYI